MPYKDPAKRRAAQAARYITDPEKFKARAAAWAKANPESGRKRSAKWGKANPAKHYATNAAWAAAHPEYIRKANRKNALIRRGRIAGTFVESVDPLTIFDRDLGVCQICHSWIMADEKWEVDHRIPLARGGPHSYANCQLAHRHCNRAKWAKEDYQICV